MQLFELKNEDALDLLADIIEPAANIMSDAVVANALRNGTPLKAVKPMIKNHKADVLEVMATLEGVPVEEYECNVFTLPKLIVKVLNEPALLDFFKSQGQSAAETSSANVTEITEETEQVTEE